MTPHENASGMSSGSDDRAEAHGVTPMNLRGSMTGIAARMLHSGNADVRRLAEEAAHSLEGWKRARADYENLHQRSVEERRAARAEGGQQALRSLTQVFDHFDTAFTTIPEELATHPWVQGVRQISQAFSQALAAEGIEVIAERNVAFDPARHEAVESVASDVVPAGTIIDVIARGYVQQGTVLRPAKVKVSSGPQVPGSPRPAKLDVGGKESLTPAAVADARGSAPQPSTPKTP